MTQKITLNMIVRNESPVIKRCLESVKPYIDFYVIVDTGSTDDTKAIIKEVMQDKPGELYEQPWVDFGTNRTQALELAYNYSRLAYDSERYILFIDADEVLNVPEGFQWPALTADAHYLPVSYGNTSYARCALVSTRLKWKWCGVVHEFLESTPAANFETLTAPKIVVHHEGARARDPETYIKDAHILEKALRADPTNARYMFYLAQSWKDAGHPRKAKYYYQERIEMPGWVEETWYAMYEIGCMNERLEASVEQVQGAYLAAYQFRPSRAEPLYQLARYHRDRRDFNLAAMFAMQAVETPYPQDKLFVNHELYTWRAKDELSISGYYAGGWLRGRGWNATRELLNGIAPESEKERIEQNLKFYEPC